MEEIKQLCEQTHGNRLIKIISRYDNPLGALLDHLIRSAEIDGDEIKTCITPIVFKTDYAFIMIQECPEDEDHWLVIFYWIDNMLDEERIKELDRISIPV